MTAVTGRPAPSGRCREFVRIAATYRGMGVPVETIAEVMVALSGDPSILPLEFELALHQYVPEPVWESDVPCAAFALAGHNEGRPNPGQGLGV